MASLAGEYRERHTVVASAAVLAAHDRIHRDLIAAFPLPERLRMAIRTVEPFRVLRVGETDPGHVSGFPHHYGVEATFHPAPA